MPRRKMVFCCLVPQLTRFTLEQLPTLPLVDILDLTFDLPKPGRIFGIVQGTEQVHRTPTGPFNGFNKLNHKGEPSVVCPWASLQIRARVIGAAAPGQGAAAVFIRPQYRGASSVPRWHPASTGGT
jgi:hypothetical protein